MAQVFRQLYYHVVWATKNRGPQLASTLRPTLVETVQDKCRRLGCRLHAVNAVSDHIHIALEIPPASAVAAVIGQLKGAGAHALNQLQPGAVLWQEGYGVLTFRRAELGKVVRYIATQEERHRTGTLSPLLESCEEPGPATEQ